MCQRQHANLHAKMCGRAICGHATVASECIYSENNSMKIQRHPGERRTAWHVMLVSIDDLGVMNVSQSATLASPESKKTEVTA